MHQLPLNSTQSFVPWALFDPGLFIDMNPSFVRFGSDDAWSVFCRYSANPKPGESSIWAVKVGPGMQPTGVPVMIVDHGIDPRIIRMGSRIFVLYALIERNQDDMINGSSVVLSEFTIDEGTWTSGSAYVLPKSPIEGHRGPNRSANWEKNWVPFCIDDGRLGIIYAHDPWQIIVINISGSTSPSLESTQPGPALEWDFGTIRGGTVPVPFDDESLVTFFHSSQVTGSRNLYCVGACVFLPKPPFTVRLMTERPLLIAPYKSTAQRFGWSFLGSVVFPLGADKAEHGYTLLCGRDDGEIASFHLSQYSLIARLSEPSTVETATIKDFRGHEVNGLPPVGLLRLPTSEAEIPDRSIVNFLDALVGRGKTFLDIGARYGSFIIKLASKFEKVFVCEPDPVYLRWLQKNLLINACVNVTLCSVEDLYSQGIDNLQRAATRVSTEDETSHDLMIDVDLVKIDLRGRTLEVLRTLRYVICQTLPMILLKIDESLENKDEIAEEMTFLQYTFEDIFSLTPDWVLCISKAKRNQYEWFI